MVVLKRIISLMLDAVTVFGMVAEMLRVLAEALDRIKNLYNYPPKS